MRRLKHLLFVLMIALPTFAQTKTKRPTLVQSLEFLHNASLDTKNSANEFILDSQGCDITIQTTGPFSQIMTFSLKDLEPKDGLRGHNGGVFLDGKDHPEVITFTISTTQRRPKIHQVIVYTNDAYDLSMDEVSFDDHALARSFALAFSDAVTDCGGENSLY